MYFRCYLRKEYKQEKMTARDLQSLIIKDMYTLHMYKRKGQGIGYKCIYTYVVIMSSLGARVLDPVSKNQSLCTPLSYDHMVGTAALV